MANGIQEIKPNDINRSVVSYARLSRNGRNGVRFSKLEEDDNIQRKPSATFLYKIKDFLTDNFLAWFVHNWWIKRRGPYPQVSRTSIHDLEEGRTAAGAPPHERISAEAAPITLCIAADWASATDQAGFVASAMRQKSPDYTIHLGDTYYSGTPAELDANFGVASTTGDGHHTASIWPRGRRGSFASPGNHEMFSSGTPFFDMIRDGTRGFGILDPDTGLFRGQENPCFCLLTTHWCILCLDTGYDSLKQKWYQRIFDLHPSNLSLEIHGSIIDWLLQTVKTRQEKRGIVVLTHHQYISAFKDEDNFDKPAGQLKTCLPDGKVILWIWGHEHRFALYGPYQKDAVSIAAHGRCIGHGGMPDEHLPARALDPDKAKKYPLLFSDNRVADTIELHDSSRTDIGYNGYAHLKIDAEKLGITYYAAYGRTNRYEEGTDHPIIEETWTADVGAGTIRCESIVDLTGGKLTGGGPAGETLTGGKTSKSPVRL